MSRSNPTDNTPNPSSRWHEWQGSKGQVQYYDKVKKENIVVKLPFTFIMLDQLARISGWHEHSQSGITSNEVRDTVQEAFLVKAFKGGVLAKGFYASIRDRVHAVGGYFAANCYIAYKNEGALSLGAIGFTGAALNAWVEFVKAHRADLYKKAVQITGYTEGKKGSIVFRVPKFALKDITEETNAQALELDKALQEYLKTYLARTRVEQLAGAPDQAKQPDAAPESQEAPPYEPEAEAPPEDENIPF